MYEISSTTHTNKYVLHALDLNELEALTKVQETNDHYVYSKATELLEKHFECE